ncbi:MAG: hypothetical protein ACYDBX_01465 [Patescibacteria group bacterium]
MESERFEPVPPVGIRVSKPIFHRKSKEEDHSVNIPEPLLAIVQEARDKGDKRDMRIIIDEALEERIG